MPLKPAAALGALASGALASLGFAPGDMWLLTLLSLSLLGLLFGDKVTARRAFTLTLLFFAALDGITLRWLDFVMEGFGGLNFAAAALILTLFALYLALPYALCAALSARLLGTHPVLFGALGLPVAWLAADYVASFLFTGFPWTYIGYTLPDSPLSSYAPLLGVRGLNLLLVVLAMCLTQAVRRRFWLLPPAALLAMGALLLQGITYTGPAGTQEVALVQANIRQELKWTAAEVDHTLATYWALTREHLKHKRLIVWPESAIPLYVDQAGQFLSDLHTAAAGAGALLALGIQRRDAAGRAYNSLLVLGSEQSPPPLYDKRHLVPFGEYVPLDRLLRPLGSFFDIPMSNFAPSKLEPQTLKLGEHRYIPAICYEVIFPTLLSDLDDDNAGALIVVSNDSWFGPTAGPPQHLAIARLRALELHKPLIRATNSGLTAVIDAAGNIARALPPDEEGVLEATVELRRGRTPYSRLGEWPLVVIALLMAAGAAVMKRRGSSRAQARLAELIRP